MGYCELAKFLWVLIQSHRGGIRGLKVILQHQSVWSHTLKHSRLLYFEENNKSNESKINDTIYFYPLAIYFGIMNYYWMS